MNDLIDVWNTIVKEDYHIPWGISALYEGIVATILSFGFSLIKCDQHKEKELILKTHFDCLGL